MMDPERSATWEETVQEGELDAFQAHAREINRFQDWFARRERGEARRGFHVKSHAGLRGELRVLDGLPDYARHGVFAEPGTYNAWVRFSNGFSAPRSDMRPDVRGFAVRLLGVQGARLRDEHGRDEQDFIALNVPFIPFRNAQDFVAISTAASRNFLTFPIHMARERGIGTAIRTMLWGIRLLRPVQSLASETYWSNLPMTLGPHAVKFMWRPRQQRGIRLNPFVPWDYFRRDLRRRLRSDSLRFDFMVQFYVNDRTTPIEMGGFPWPESDAPFVRLAELTIPAQDLDADAARSDEEFLNSTAFNPWNGIAAHRPLGNSQRARAGIYAASALHRGYVEDSEDAPHTSG